MIPGVPRETFQGERHVALVPEGVERLTAKGNVFVATIIAPAYAQHALRELGDLQEQRGDEYSGV
jgi:alanine dehydrogenase